MANNLVKGSGCGTREWREDFALTDTDSNTNLFSVAQATGNTSVAGSLSVGGAMSMSSTTAALTPPKLTTTQRNALTATAGMVIYNTTTNKLNVYTTTWEAVTSA